MDWLSTIRGRAGLSLGSFLIYATGGVAFTNVNVSKEFRWDFTDGCPIVAGLQSCHVGGTDKTRVGGTVGAGLEWALPADPRWSLKAEYLYANFGDVTYTTFNRGTLFTPPTAPQPVNHGVSTELHIARVGINFRFW